jgi:hypothetical protein
MATDHSDDRGFMSNESAKNAAFHEAGHAVAAASLRLLGYDASVFLLDTGEFAGIYREPRGSSDIAHMALDMVAKDGWNEWRRRRKGLEWYEILKQSAKHRLIMHMAGAMAAGMYGGGCDAAEVLETEHEFFTGAECLCFTGYDHFSNDCDPYADDCDHGRAFRLARLLYPTKAGIGKRGMGALERAWSQTGELLAVPEIRETVAALATELLHCRTVGGDRLWYIVESTCGLAYDVGIASQ